MNTPVNNEYLITFKFCLLMSKIPKIIIPIQIKRIERSINLSNTTPRNRIDNPINKPVKILEIQTGEILKETDIVRYQDIYGRVK